MMMSGGQIFGGVEAGGTKFICAVARDPLNPLDRREISTTTPEETLTAVCDFFDKARNQFGRLERVGVGSFGPVDISLKSPSYGQMLSTPKAEWREASIVAALEKRLGVSTALDTDVNCALLGEALYGAGQSIKNLAYATIGTGVGVGLMADGAILYGESHPELGHAFAPKHPDDAAFEGVCEYHGAKCFEGLVSGPAIEARVGGSAASLPLHHPVWPIVAHYISLLCLNIFLCVSPKKIILGGGVMKQAHLLPLIRETFRSHLGGYVGSRYDILDREEFISPVGLDGDAGVIGAMALVARQSGEQSDDLACAG